MKKCKRMISYFLAIVLVVGFSNMGVYAKTSDDNVRVVDTIISREEYISAIAKYEGTKYEEAESTIFSQTDITRLPPESVVVIHRKIYKTINSAWDLVCSVYIEALRDNRTSDYIEIVAVRAPYVDLEYFSDPVGATMNGNAEASFSGTTVTIYYNGSVTYSIEGLDVSIELLPGVSVGGSSSILYRYSVSTTFTKTI